MIRALVFDFDGLILDTETATIDAYESVHRRHARPFSRQLAQEAVGRVELHFDPWQAFGESADRVALERERLAENHAIVARQAALPGVIACLQAARRLGLRIGLASNSSHDHVERHLARIGLASYFEYLRCIEDVAAGKPAPDLYRAVVEKFGVPAAQAVAFEDSAHGVQAAKAAGLWCVAVPGPSSVHHDLSQADLTLASLADCPLAELLARFGP